MNRILSNNKGFILIFSFLVLIFLLGLEAALFLRSINEKIGAQKVLDTLKAGYAAEQGIQSAIFELQMQSNVWATHSATDIDPPNRSEFILAPLTHEVYPFLPDPQNRIDYTEELGHFDTNSASDTYGCYIRENADGSPFFKVKVYGDPLSGGGDEPGQYVEKVILSRGFSNGISRLMVTKYSSESLYDYFMFTPYPLSFGWKTYDAYGAKIHTNDDITLYELATIKNVSELSTGDGKSLKYYVNSYVPPRELTCAQSGATNCGSYANVKWKDIYWSWSDPLVAQNKGGLNTSGNWDDNGNWYVNQSDGHLYGNSRGIQMEYPAGTYITWDPTLCPTCLPLVPDNLTDALYQQLYFTGYLPVVFANDDNDGNSNNNFSVIIPNRLDVPNNYTAGSLPYQWNIYEDAARYGYPAETKPVWFTNSGWLPTAWQNFLNNNGLENFIKTNGDGKYIATKTISSGVYEQSAMSNGIYISKCSTPPQRFGATINNTLYCADENNEIKIGNKVIMKQRSFWNTSTTELDTVIDINVGQLGTAAPSKGVIYSTGYNILVENAARFPSTLTNGLTLVSDKNIYLNGDFNKFAVRSGMNWVQPPAAAIAAGYVYTLSNAFGNGPQALPATIHNPNHPNIDDSECPADPGCMGWNNTNLPNQAADTTYNVSLVGYYGYEPQILEQWAWQQGNNSVSAQRKIVGSFIRLREDNFPPNFSNGDPGKINKVRCQPPLGTFANGRDCTLPPNGYGEYFAWDMTTVIPNLDKNLFYYNTNYLQPGARRPPGDLSGFTQTAQLEIDNTEYNFTHHYMAIF